MKEQQFQRQMQTGNEPKDHTQQQLNDITDLVKKGKVDQETLALLWAVTGVEKNGKVRKDDYDKLKELDNKVFDNADLWIGKDGTFTIVDKKSGEAFHFDKKISVTEKTDIHPSRKFEMLFGAVLGYIEDGKLTASDISKIKKADEIVDNANVTIGSEKISVVDEVTANSINFRDFTPPVNHSPNHGKRR